MNDMEETRIKRLLDLLDQQRVTLDKMKLSLDGLEAELRVRLNEKFEVIHPTDGH